MRWLTTKTLFTLWRALMWGYADDRRLFLQLLKPILDQMTDRSSAALAAEMNKRGRNANH